MGLCQLRINYLTDWFRNEHPLELLFEAGKERCIRTLKK